MTSGYMDYLDLVWDDEEYIGVVPVVEDGQLYLVVARRWEEDHDDYTQCLTVCVCRWQEGRWQDTRVWHRVGDYDELCKAWQRAGTQARESPSDALLKARL